MSTAKQRLAYHLRRGVKPWPPRVENRQPGLKYPFFSRREYVCSCGELIRNDIGLVRPTPGFYWGKFQHGENREAVLVLDAFDDHVLTMELEQRLADWASTVHEYQRSRA